MLRTLAIRDFVLVERAEIEFQGGFTVLSGETGAGKSMLIDALELLVGGRADAGLVRDGAERADLSAEFEITDSGAQGLRAWLAEHDLTGDDGTLLLRRTLDREGRSRAFINGHAATQAQLREAGEYLLDIHGQHAHQSLLRAAAQRQLLDSRAGCEVLAAETAALFQSWKRLETLAAQAQAEFSQREAERAELEEKIADLSRLAPRPGEWQELTAAHARLAHGSSLLEGTQAAVEGLIDAEGSLVPQLGALANRMRTLAVHDAKLNEWLELLDSAQAMASEAARGLRHYASKIELDAGALHTAEVRIEALHAAGRRFRRKPEELAPLLAELEGRLREMALHGDPEALRREVDAQAARYAASAAKLSAGRRSAAQAFSKAVSAGMQVLAMKGGRFGAELRPLDTPSAQGLEAVEFQVAAHPSLPLRALAKVASGGELSRLSLAIQLVASRASPVATLIFDEVDSGIGGAVAETVGKSLRRLGAERQVLCVTHLPQVAAQGDQQWLVSKAAGKSKLGVSVARLSREQRVEELARMLAGAEITPITRQHAAELLDG